MKYKKSRRNRAPLSHSNLSEEEYLRSLFDPNGSYTGTPDNDGYPATPDGDKPVQDADDL